LQTIDTILVKLYAEFERTAELYDLIQSHNDVKLSEIERALIKSGQYSALCTLYKQGKEDTKLLEAWAKYVNFSVILVTNANTLPRLVDGEWSDVDITDPLSQIFDFLSEKRDNALFKQWGIWLIKRGPARGLKVPSVCKNAQTMLIKNVSVFAAPDAAGRRETSRKPRR